MKTTPVSPIKGLNRSAGNSMSKRFRTHGFETTRHFGDIPRKFTLLLTTSHPESPTEGAGEVACGPAELTGTTAVIELHDVTRIDGWGLALLLEVLKRIAAQAGANIALVGVHETVSKILELGGSDQPFRIFSSREEALADQRHLLAA